MNRNPRNAFGRRQSCASSSSVASSPIADESPCAEGLYGSSGEAIRQTKDRVETLGFKRFMLRISVERTMAQTELSLETRETALSFLAPVSGSSTRGGGSAVRDNTGQPVDDSRGHDATKLNPI
ncbi:hypothetical protein [Mesorhizobium sp. 128a]